MAIEKVWAGSYLQLSDGQAPPEDWVVALESTAEDREITVFNITTRAYLKVSRKDLYLVTSALYEKAIRLWHTSTLQEYDEKVGANGRSQT